MLLLIIFEISDGERGEGGNIWWKRERIEEREVGWVKKSKERGEELEGDKLKLRNVVIFIFSRYNLKINIVYSLFLMFWWLFLY